MTDDPLRDRIARLDPAADHATDPITSATAHVLLEEIMNTPLETEAEQQTAPRSPRKRWALPTLIAAAAVIVLAIVGVVAKGGFGGDSHDEIADAPATTAPGKLEVIELSAVRLRFRGGCS